MPEEFQGYCKKAIPSTLNFQEQQAAEAQLRDSFLKLVGVQVEIQSESESESENNPTHYAQLQQTIEQQLPPNADYTYTTKKHRSPLGHWHYRLLSSRDFDDSDYLQFFLKQQPVANQAPEISSSIPTPITPAPVTASTTVQQERPKVVERKCTATVKGTNKRCSKWALKNNSLCYAHRKK